jgi:hypothetical protein
MADRAGDADDGCGLGACTGAYKQLDVSPDIVRFRRHVRFVVDLLDDGSSVIRIEPLVAERQVGGAGVWLRRDVDRDL